MNESFSSRVESNTKSDGTKRSLLSCFHLGIMKSIYRHDRKNNKNNKNHYHHSKKIKHYVNEGEVIGYFLSLAERWICRPVLKYIICVFLEGGVGHSMLGWKFC